MEENGHQMALSEPQNHTSTSPSEVKTSDPAATANGGGGLEVLGQAVESTAAAAAPSAKSRVAASALAATSESLVPAPSLPAAIGQQPLGPASTPVVPATPVPVAARGVAAALYESTAEGSGLPNSASTGNPASLAATGDAIAPADVRTTSSGTTSPGYGGVVAASAHQKVMAAAASAGVKKDDRTTTAVLAAAPALDPVHGVTGIATPPSPPPPPPPTAPETSLAAAAPPPPTFGVERDVAPATTEMTTMTSTRDTDTSGATPAVPDAAAAAAAAAPTAGIATSPAAATAPAGAAGTGVSPESANVSAAQSIPEATTAAVATAAIAASPAAATAPAGATGTGTVSSGSANVSAARSTPEAAPGVVTTAAIAAFPTVAPTAARASGTDTASRTTATATAAPVMDPTSGPDAGDGSPLGHVPQVSTMAATQIVSVPAPVAPLAVPPRAPIGSFPHLSTVLDGGAPASTCSITALGTARGVFADISAFTEESIGRSLPPPPPPPAPPSTTTTAPTCTTSSPPADPRESHAGGIPAAAEVLLSRHGGAGHGVAGVAGVGPGTSGVQQATETVAVASGAQQPKLQQQQQQGGTESVRQVLPAAVEARDFEEKQQGQRVQTCGAGSTAASVSTTVAAVDSGAELEARAEPSAGGNNGRLRKKEMREVEEGRGDDDAEAEEDAPRDGVAGNRGGARKRKKVSHSSTSSAAAAVAPQLPLPPPPSALQPSKRKKQSPKKQLQQRQAAAETAAAARTGKPKYQQKKLQLHAPDFEIEKHGGGKIRKRYSLDFKVKAARYALSKDPKGQAKGGTVGARYAAAQLGIPESQSVRDWMRRLPQMEEALGRAQAEGGESAAQHIRRKRSMSSGRVPSTHKIEAQLLEFIKQEASSFCDGLGGVRGLKVSSRAVKDKAQELMPDVFGVPPSRNDSYGGGGDDYPSALKRHEAKISSWCHRFLKRHRVSSLCENPLKRRRVTSAAAAAGGGGGGVDYEEGTEGEE